MMITIVIVIYDSRGHRGERRVGAQPLGLRDQGPAIKIDY